MLCERCKKHEATGHYEGTVKGVKTTMRLCTRCLLDKQKELFGDLDMFSGFVGGVRRMRCPSCGTDLKSVTKTLFVGCPDCYKAFEGELDPIIKNIQNATSHVGLVPAGDKSSNLTALKQQLNKAVEEERFEDAAALSRKIKQLLDDDKGGE